MGFFRKNRGGVFFVYSFLCAAVYFGQAVELAIREDHPRLLNVSRECMNRVYALGLAWRWMGEEKYAVKCKENLPAACDFGGGAAGREKVES